jgi:hypothetical protein
MPTYNVYLYTTIGLTVEIDAPDEDTALDAAWQPAEDYLNTLPAQHHGDAEVWADATLDGIGADDAKLVE